MSERKWKTLHAAWGQLGKKSVDRDAPHAAGRLRRGDDIYQCLQLKPDSTKSLQAGWGHFLIGPLGTKRYILIIRLYNAAPVMPFTGFGDIDKPLTPHLITYRPIRI